MFNLSGPPTIPTQKTRVIVQRGEPLTEQEIADAFRGNGNTQWFKALIQMINEYRYDYADKMASNAGANNPLGMARDSGAYEALSDLLRVLESQGAQKNP